MSAWLYLFAAIVLFVSGFYANTYLRENYGIEFNRGAIVMGESSSKSKGKRSGDSKRSKGASSKGKRDKKKGADSKAGSEAGAESKKGTASRKGSRSHGKKHGRSSSGHRSASLGTPASRKP